MTAVHEQGEPLMDIAEVARLFGVTVKTVRRWDQPGQLPSVRTPGRGPRRYHRADVDAFLAAKQGAA